MLILLNPDKLINNYNKVIKLTKIILTKPLPHGFEHTDIFTPEQLAVFADDALTYFNSIPPLTNFTFNDSEFVDKYLQILAEYSALIASASQDLIENGRVFALRKVSKLFKNAFVPPATSEIMLETNYSARLNDWICRVKNEKTAFYDLL